jgi:hypothetical protein
MWNLADLEIEKLGEAALGSLREGEYLVAAGPVSPWN